MDIDIVPEVVHDAVICMQSISELRTKPGNEAIWLKVFREKSAYPPLFLNLR